MTIPPILFCSLCFCITLGLSLPLTLLVTVIGHVGVTVEDNPCVIFRSRSLKAVEGDVYAVSVTVGHKNSDAADLDDLIILRLRVKIVVPANHNVFLFREKRHQVFKFVIAVAEMKDVLRLGMIGDNTMHVERASV